MNVTDLLKGNGSAESARDTDHVLEDASCWRVLGSHMVSNCPRLSHFKKYCEENQSKAIKIAAFDMDDTIICTKSGIKFGRGYSDWKWRTPEVLPVLRSKVRDLKHVMVIFTNQASISVTQTKAENSKSYRNFRKKLDMILSSLKEDSGHLQPLVFASTGRPGMSVKPRSSIEQHFRTRKPETGMWGALELYIKRALGEDYTIDKDNSFYVGDAAGRPGDHLADDKGFAENVGIQFYEPEQFFGS